MALQLPCEKTLTRTGYAQGSITHRIPTGRLQVPVQGVPRTGMIQGFHRYQSAHLWGFTDELQRLRPRRCQFWGNDGLPPRHPLKVRPWLKGNTRAIAASATKKRLSLSLQPTTWTLDLCRTNSRVSLRQRRCSSPKAVPSYVSIALKDSEGTTVTPLTWRRISAVS